MTIKLEKIDTNEEAIEVDAFTQTERRKVVKYPDPIFLDRIDIQVEIVPVTFDEMTHCKESESSIEIRKRVIEAREIQEMRFNEVQGIYCNAQMTSKLINKYCSLDKKAIELLRTAMTKFDLSARAYDRILKVARTIADLEKSESVMPSHIAEAISYRSLDMGNRTNR